MSSYLNHHEGPNDWGIPSQAVTHDWRTFTEDRLRWLYGPDAVLERAVQAQRDLAAWNGLGQRSAA